MKNKYKSRRSKRKGVNYYLTCYVPFAYEIDKYFKKKVLQYMKRKLAKREVRQFNEFL